MFKQLFRGQNAINQRITGTGIGMLQTYADYVVLIDHAIVKKGTPAEVLASEEFQNIFHRKGGAL